MKNRTVIIVVGVVVLVLGLAGAAVLLSGGDDANSGGVLAPGETPAPTYGDDVQENRSVEVTGDPLPRLEIAGPDDPALGAPVPVVDGATFDGVRRHDRRGHRRSDDVRVPRPLVPALQRRGPRTDRAEEP